jgi:hypothetical protein
MPFTTVAAGAPGVFVDSESALADAYATLSTTPGGGTIYLTRGFSPDDQIALFGGGRHPVHITSANPNNPVEISRISFDDVDNVRVSNVNVDSSDVSRPDFMRDMDINDSSRIEIANSTFTSNGSVVFDPTDRNAILGERLSMVRDSQDITVTGNYISGYEQGLTFQESSQLTISNNEITAMQGDGIRLAGVENVMVSGNYMHDFSATPNEFTHSDFIQMWTRNADTMSRDVTITGNVLDTGNGVAVQAIWVGNTEYRGGNTSHIYRDIEVTDNLIYSGAANGIGIEGANGVLVEDNTLLWNQDAVTIKANGDTSFAPRIRLEGVRNGEVNNNITPNIVSDRDDSLSDNIIISYDPRDPNYVGDHFVNAVNGGDVGLRGLQLRSGSDFVGTGASSSQPGGSASAGAGDEAPRSGGGRSEPEPEPTSGGGRSEPEQNSGGGRFRSRSEEDEAPQAGANTGANASTLFSANFENGVEDLSGFDSDLRSGSDRNIVDTPDGSGFRIGSGRMVRLDVENEQIHSLDSFGLEMEITLLESDDVGRFLHFPRTFEASVGRDGTVTFELRTDEGVFQVNSGDVVLNDGDTHLFAVGYDDAAGTLSMSIDGTVVGTTDASGSTDDASFHGLTVGTIWGNSVNAVVDDIFLGTDPMEAGVDLSLDVGETFDPAPDAPVGGLVGGGSGGRGGVAQTDNEDDVPDGTDFFTTLLDIDFESRLRDASDFDSDIRIGDVRDITRTGRGDNAYEIGGRQNDYLALDRDNAQIHELDSFGLSLDIQLLDASDEGRFIHFPRAFEAVIEEDRSVSFRLDTDEGSFRVNSGDTTLDDLREHTFSIGYDGDAKQLTMAIDGDVVDSVAASGETAPMAFHGLAVGSIWGDGVTARVDNVWLGEPAPGSDVSPDAGLLHALISSAVEADPDEDRNDDDDDALAA